MLELTNVKKSYQEQLILDIPRLRLHQGIYWIKGPNGSGKTTLLKMAAGLLPFEGDIAFKGVHLRSQPLAYRQMISWAEAEPLYPVFLAGSEIISLYREIRKADQKSVDRLIEIFGVRNYMDNPIGTYSAGMTKKLSLLLAFLGDPCLIVLDEPLITLDTSSLAAVSSLIGEKCMDSEVLFLLSSHQEADMQMLPAGEELFVNDLPLSNP